jgi:hypothetical protein
VPQGNSPSLNSKHALALCVACVVLCALPACDDHNSTPSVRATELIQAPISIDLYPVNEPLNPRLFVLVIAGSENEAIPLAFDTGSSGVTLNALKILPDSMVDSGGFKFPDGVDTLTYRGITITKTAAMRMYGGPTGRTQIGNIGFASISFGNFHGAVDTRSMPVLLYYSEVETDDGGPVPSDDPQEGWFGVNSGADLLIVNGVSEPASSFPECTKFSTATCTVASVLDYLDYAPGISAGLLLTPAQLADCDISAPSSCRPQSILTVGLTEALKAGFSRWDLTCQDRLIAGYRPCTPTVANAVFTATGPTPATLTAPVLFDSGTPDILVRTTSNTAFPLSIPAGETASVMAPSGFVYGYDTGQTGLYATVVAPVGTREIVIGLPFFTTNSIFIDLAGGNEGWK